MTEDIKRLLASALEGRRPSHDEALALATCEDLSGLMTVAAALRDSAHGIMVSYSRKVFIPLTQLCRDVCHYCTFAHAPRTGERAYLPRDEVLEIGRASCRERV